MQRVNEHEGQFRNGDSGVKYMFRGPRIDWGVIRFLPGQQLGLHYHDEVEETFYFPEGTPLMWIDGHEYRVQAGDAFRIEPKEHHNIINDTNAPVDLIFIKSVYRPQDKVDVKA